MTCTAGLVAIACPLPRMHAVAPLAACRHTVSTARRLLRASTWAGVGRSAGGVARLLPRGGCEPGGRPRAREARSGRHRGLARGDGCNVGPNTGPAENAAKT
jgi:hypothetical protein